MKKLFILLIFALATLAFGCAVQKVASERPQWVDAPAAVADDFAYCVGTGSTEIGAIQNAKLNMMKFLSDKSLRSGSAMKDDVYSDPDGNTYVKWKAKIIK